MKSLLVCILHYRCMTTSIQHKQLETTWSNTQTKLHASMYHSGTLIASWIAHSRWQHSHAPMQSMLTLTPVEWVHDYAVSVSMTHDPALQRSRVHRGWLRPLCIPCAGGYEVFPYLWMLSLTCHQFLLVYFCTIYCAGGTALQCLVYAFSTSMHRSLQVPPLIELLPRSTYTLAIWLPHQHNGWATAASPVERAALHHWQQLILQPGLSQSQ